MSELTDELIEDGRDRMAKSVESTKHEFASVRTGRASPALLDRIVVDYYGTATPLKQLATISAPEARMLTLQPYDKSSIKAIERGDPGVGHRPDAGNDGNLIRLSIPELTEERRKQLVKVVRHIAEEGRVAIRNVRRSVMHDLRELKESGDAGADDEHRAEAELQKLDRRANRGARRGSQAQGRRDPRGVTWAARSPTTGGAGRAGRPVTSRSSRTATAAGRRRVACRCSTATRPGRTRSRRACAMPSISASRS